ncbi:MAG TPA: activator of HSP90 ATPase [Actinoplanes sp.]|nr:activator of HSP90 ATPase [Actinoplanes sp.]
MTDERVLKPYRVEVELDSGRDDVWDAMTQPPVLRQWFGWDYHGLDAEIKQIFVDEATLVSPERMGWADGSYLEVTGGDDRSTVRAVREGPAPEHPDAYDAIEEGWRAFLVQLRFFLRERPTGVRRTLRLTGETTARQALALVDGEWERADSRVAWTVDPAGHLVVVAGHVPLSEWAAAHTEVTVSTYGLDDRAFAAMRDEWVGRWAPIADRPHVAFDGTPAPGR